MEKRFANYVMQFSLAWLKRTFCILCGSNILVRFFISIALAGLSLISVYENARFSTYITMFAIQCNWNIATEKKNSKQSCSAAKLCL